MSEKRKSTGLTKEQRVLRARAAAYAMHAQGKTNTAPARERAPQSLAYWFDKVDPEHALSEGERIKRAEQARYSHMLTMSYKASLAAQKNRERRKRERQARVDAVDAKQNRAAATTVAACQTPTPPQGGSTTSPMTSATPPTSDAGSSSPDSSRR